MSKQLHDIAQRFTTVGAQQALLIAEELMGRGKVDVLVHINHDAALNEKVARLIAARTAEDRVGDTARAVADDIVGVVAAHLESKRPS